MTLPWVPLLEQTLLCIYYINYYIIKWYLKNKARNTSRYMYMYLIVQGIAVCTPAQLPSLARVWPPSWPLRDGWWMGITAMEIAAQKNWDGWWMDIPRWMDIQDGQETENVWKPICMILRQRSPNFNDLATKYLRDHNKLHLNNIDACRNKLYM